MAENIIFGTHLIDVDSLEPVDESICEFCGDEIEKYESDNVYSRLRKNEQLNDYILYRTLSYDVIKVGIPCCKKCAKKLRIIKILRIPLLVLNFVIFVLLLPFVFLFIGPECFLPFIIGGSVLLIIHAFCYRQGRDIDWLCKLYKIQRPRDIATKYELTSALIEQGWKQDPRDL